MTIKMMLAQEAVNKYNDMRDAECYYEKLLRYYTERAKNMLQKFVYLF